MLTPTHRTAGLRRFIPQPEMFAGRYGNFTLTARDYEILGLIHNYRYLDRVAPDANFLTILTDVIAAERVIYIARPGLFHLLFRQDETLMKQATLSAPMPSAKSP